MSDYFKKALEGDAPKKEPTTDKDKVVEKEVHLHDDKKPETEVKPEVKVEESKKIEEVETKVEEPKFSENDFYKYASEMLGKDVKSKEDLTILQEKEVEKEVERQYKTEFSKKYDNFYYETGRTVKEFELFNRDLTQLSEDDVIKESLRAKNPNLSDAEVNFMYSKEYLYDEEEMTNDEVMSKKINKKVAFNNAFNQLSSDKEKYGVSKKDSLKSQEALFKEQQDVNAANSKNWRDAVDATSKDFNSIDIDLGENFKYKHTVNQEVKNLAKDIVSDDTMQKFLTQFQDKKGATDTKKMQELVYFWNNRNVIMKEVAEQSASRQLESITKEGKFINFKSDSKPKTDTEASKRAKENLELLRASRG